MPGGLNDFPSSGWYSNRAYSCILLPGGLASYSPGQCTQAQKLILSVALLEHRQLNAPQM